MIKDIQTIRRLLATNCMSVFDHFVELALKGQVKSNFIWILFRGISIAKQLYISILNYFKQLKKKQFNYKEMIS